MLKRNYTTPQTMITTYPRPLTGRRCTNALFSREAVKPKHPIVLAHGLLGFDELRIAKRALPAIHYWRGIKDAYSINGVEVITAPVSPSASIEQRAEELLKGIENRAEGRKVNIIA